jgi:ABC-type branched-subunit amino acid transport system substrate-binding protein
MGRDLSLGDAIETASDVPFSRIQMVTGFSLCRWFPRWVLYAAGLATLGLAGCEQIDPKWKDHLGLVEKPVPIRVGILHSETGTMSISETSLRDTELMAIAEINAAGGVLGRPIEAVVKDGRSRDDLFVKRARSLLEDYGLQVVFGCWTSSSRKAVTPLFEQEDALLFYPLQYEGNEASKNVFYFGSTPNQQILPALDWFMSDAGGNRKKVYLVGSDYIFPRTAHYVVRKYLEGKGMEVVGESFAPLGSRDFAEIVSRIVTSGADLVLSTVNGDSNVDFYQQFHQLAGQVGLDSDKLPIVATSIGENELRSLLPEIVQGHYVAASYFQSIARSTDDSSMPSGRNMERIESPTIRWMRRMCRSTFGRRPSKLPAPPIPRRSVKCSRKRSSSTVLAARYASIPRPIICSKNSDWVGSTAIGSSTSCMSRPS